jgi:hypothetical protein
MQLVQSVANHHAAMLGVAIHELAIQAVNPGGKEFFGSRSRRQEAVFVSGHRSISLVGKKWLNHSIGSRMALRLVRRDAL